MDYQQKLFHKYVTNQALIFQGKFNIHEVKKQFPAWDRYFGRHFPKDKNSRVLDIGCGYGGFLYYLKDLGYTDCLGIEVSQEQVDLAGQLGITNTKKADLREFLQGKDGKYDVIFARDVLEHLPKEAILDSLALIYNALSPEGVFIMQSPNGESPFSGRYRYNDFTHEVAFSLKSLSQIFTQVGFKKFEFYPTSPVIHGVKSFVRFLLWKMVEIIPRLFILIETGEKAGIVTQNIIAVAKKS